MDLLEVPENARLTFRSEVFDTGENIKIHIPPRIEIPNFPKLIEGPGLPDYTTTIEGNDLILPGNFFMSGRLNFFGNRIFSVLNDGTIINGAGLTNRIRGITTTSLRDTNVLFGNEIGSNYVSFRRDTLSINAPSDQDGPVVDFNEGNAYVEVDEGGFFVIQPLKDSEVVVINRDDEEKISEIIIKGDVVVIDGDRRLEVINDEVYLVSDKSSPNKSASPVEIKLVDERGNSNLQEHNVFVDNSGGIVVISEEQSEEVASSEGEDVSEIAVVRVGPSRSSVDIFLGRLFGKLRKFAIEIVGEEELQTATAITGVKG